VIADCAEFRIRRVLLGAGERLHVAAGEQPRLLSVVRGRLSLQAEGGGEKRSFTVDPGENLLLPYGGTFTFAADATTILLLTENFV
jgi:mannose-6-phosphate isomerase